MGDYSSIHHSSEVNPRRIEPLEQRSISSKQSPVHDSIYAVKPATDMQQQKQHLQQNPSQTIVSLPNKRVERSVQTDLVISKLSEQNSKSAANDSRLEDSQKSKDDLEWETLTQHKLTMVNHPWSKRILTLVSNKAKLMDSFSWLSTVGGGFSSLGERDNKFSMRAGALSLNQQLQIAELLGDERLKVMCHLFAAVAALQLGDKHFCINYIRRVILPLINSLPYRDPVLTNMLRHICFRVSMLDRFVSYRNAAIEGRNSKEGQ